MAAVKKGSSLFSSSCVATVLMGLYICMACFNLYGLMYPLAFVDLTPFPPERFVHPLWQAEEQLHMKIYLSTSSKFHGRPFVASEFVNDEDDSAPRRKTSPSTVLLWKQDIDAASLSKSFLLSNLDCLQKSRDGQACNGEKDPSFLHANEWLDQKDEMLLHHNDGGVLSTIQAAGQGVESTSILLTLYQAVSNKILSLFSTHSNETDTDISQANNGIMKRSMIYLPQSSPIWSNLMSNKTVHVHVVVVRQSHNTQDARTIEDGLAALTKASRSHSLLTGHVGLVKFDAPNHLSKPGRILYKDIVYLVQKYILGLSDKTIRPPWDMEYAKPEYYQAYHEAQVMKEKSIDYPYWKPEVAVKYLIDRDSYPYELAQVSGMSHVQVPKSATHPVGLAHIPALHVDEIGLTSEKYIPLNETITSLPLHVTFDRSDMKEKGNQRTTTTATAGGISPARWRLLTHLSQSFETQKELGFEQSDIDDLRRLIADTNVTLLAITMLASALHLLFEFLTFKNEVSFWQNNTDLTGLSVRSLFLDMIGQVIIVLYLIEKDSSLLMTIPSGIGCLIALWKCQRAAGFAFVRVTSKDQSGHSSWWNTLPRLVGYEIRATRLDTSHLAASTDKAKTEGEKENGTISKQDLHALSLECDRIATQYLGAVFLPMVAAYAVYTLVMVEHSGWYSWLVTSASSAVYALGFVLMTPQLFLNYKLKSVAHLPWRVLVYKSLNTFIDDLFSFIIRMPTMARISCFRDDVVFFIYLYQRWLYPVDTSRPVEGGGDTSAAELDNVSAETKKNQ